MCLFASVFGTFLDSFLGSYLEEIWWCASKKRVIKFEEHACEDCKQARKENRNVLGHLPTRCGHICGHQVLSGNGINILSCSITSILVGLGLIHVYLKWICLLMSEFQKWTLFL